MNGSPSDPAAPLAGAGLADQQHRRGIGRHARHLGARERVVAAWPGIASRDGAGESSPSAPAGD